MLGLAAAPLMAMAVPILMLMGSYGPAYSPVGRQPTRKLPEWSALTVSDSALRCCFMPRKSNAKSNEGKSGR